MDSKLKQLKVADLKKLLAQANVSHPPKATKADLIAIITKNEAAVNVYNKLHGPQEVVDVDEEPPAEVAEPPTAEPEPTTPSEPEPEPAEPASTTEPEPTEPVDPELEKRKQRAARFGIPLVEPKKAPPPKSKKGAAKPAQTGEDNEKLAERAARFGMPNKEKAAGEQPTGPKARGNKRTQPPEVIDPDELERRKKRAERFGLNVKP